MMPEKMLPPSCMAVPPMAEFECTAAPMVPVPIPACKPCAPARLFMEVGLVLVCASCVFSSGMGCEAPFRTNITVGLCDLVAGSALAVAEGAAALPEDDDGPLPDAAMMASISPGVTPALCSAIKPSGEVSNFTGRDWIVETTTDSGRPPFTILITSRLVKGFCAC